MHVKTGLGPSIETRAPKSIFTQVPNPPPTPSPTPRSSGAPIIAGHQTGGSGQFGGGGVWVVMIGYFAALIFSISAISFRNSDQPGSDQNQNLPWLSKRCILRCMLAACLRCFWSRWCLVSVFCKDKSSWSVSGNQTWSRNHQDGRLSNTCKKMTATSENAQMKFESCVLCPGPGLTGVLAT